MIGFKSLPWLFLLSSGCATIISGRSETIRIESEPSGIKVLVDGMVRTTPVAVDLLRGRHHHLVFPGALQVVVRQAHINNGWVVLDTAWLLVGMVPFLVAILVDSSTGAMFNLEPDYLVWRDGVVYNGDNGSPITAHPSKAMTSGP